MLAEITSTLGLILVLWDFWGGTGVGVWCYGCGVIEIQFEHTL